ncbi:hypothetical protein THTE_4484 [Thermogutta terrifontis]|uniref:Carboxypeptidase regulatory-like domain-containing protein n=1 Tax=Thermogutta terrifontis TaxID=1331910 RepID=A0A286RM80_9BACT|nr:hypothetical protein [Thermogutta terrifontis]ASV77085.1 hypothetical protein THTE_4484 [Thermogutta terrifontis]
MKHSPFFLGALCMSTLCLFGCKKAADNRPKRVPATVTVTYRGAAVEGATVTFHPANPDGKPAFGRTDAQGRASLTTFDPNDGALPGDYVVTVVKMVGSEQSLQTPSTEIGAMPANPVQGGAPPLQNTGARHLLPAKYADPNSSGLRATVNPSGENDFKFDLQD